MNIFRKVLCCGLMTLMAINLWAAKSSGAVHIWNQPDGTKISVQLLGDEYMSWYQTTDGVLLVPGDDGAFYVAAVAADGAISATKVLAHNVGMRTSDELSLVNAQHRDAFFAMADKTMLSARKKAIAGYPSSRACPHTGKVRIPVIVMSYTDKAITLDDATIYEYFNGTGKTPYTTEGRFDGYGSVAQFFKDASFGQFEPVFDIYGPYTTNNAHNYYGKATQNSLSDNKKELLYEAVQKADPDIDFSQYDSNGDGHVDMVYILYAGTGANLSGDYRDVWPACYPGNQNISTKDGKTITTIGCANELAAYASYSPSGKDLRAGIGVTCHEMSHGLGLPDLYNTGKPKNPETGKPDYSNCGPEDWDLMDGGENMYNAMWPCTYTAWERDVMGWLDIEELTEPTEVTIYPLNDPEGRGKAYRVTNPANPNEYYILENNISNEWNYYQNQQYGTGLMVFHLNSKADGFDMRPNDIYGKPNITIVPADGYILGSTNQGETIMYKGKLVTMPGVFSEFRSKYFVPDAKGDPYPGSMEVTSLAAYNNYTKVDGEDMVTRFPITNITKNADGSISFKFMDTTTPVEAVREVANGNDGRIYSLDGRCLGTDTFALPSGLYIHNGNKVMKR